MGDHQRVPTSAKIGQRLTLASWFHFGIFWKCIVFEKKSCWTWAERIRFWARFQTNWEMSRLGSRENLQIQDRIVRRCFNETWNCGRRWPNTLNRSRFMFFYFLSGFCTRKTNRIRKCSYYATENPLNFNGFSVNSRWHSSCIFYFCSFCEYRTHSKNRKTWNDFYSRCLGSSTSTIPGFIEAPPDYPILNPEILAWP